MSNPRYHNIISAAEYAKLNGISARTARRQLAESSNAVKTGRGYKVAIPSTTYAKLKGITPTEARRSGTKSTDPIRDVVAQIPGTSRVKLLQTLTSLATGARRDTYRSGLQNRNLEINQKTIREGISRMTTAQRLEASKFQTPEDFWEATGDDFFLDEDGDSVLWYH